MAREFETSNNGVKGLGGRSNAEKGDIRAAIGLSETFPIPAAGEVVVEKAIDINRNPGIKTFHSNRDYN